MKLVLMTFLALPLHAQPAPKAQADEITALRKRIAELELKIAQTSMNAEVAFDFVKAFKDRSLSAPWIDIQLDELRRLVRILPSTAFFDPSEVGQGYQSVATAVGIIPVMLLNIEPLGDGQKITIQVGNPTTAIFTGIRVMAKWNRARPKDGKGWKEWDESLRSQKFDLSTRMPAGSWSNVSIILPATEPKDVGFVSLSFEVPSMSMSKPSTQ